MYICSSKFVLDPQREVFKDWVTWQAVIIYIKIFVLEKNTITFQ